MPGDYAQNNRRDQNEHAFLHEASLDGDLEQIEVLLAVEHKLKLNDENGNTSLHVGVRGGQYDAAKKLHDENEVDRTNQFGFTPLHVASLNGDLSAVKLLVGSGAKVNQTERHGLTPIHMASLNGHLDIVKFLLDKGAAAEWLDNHGLTPLYLASQNGKVDVVQDLVDRGASLTSRSKDGWTPLHVASQNGKIDVVKYLLEKGAAIDSRANFGRTPLHLASLFGHLNVVQYLFDRGSAVDATDADGQTPLDLASENGQLDVLKYLLKKGATVDNIKDAGSNAVHIASLNGHLNIVNFYLDNGVTVDKTGTSGQTALHFASSNGHLNIVKYLIGKGASVNSRDNNGQTPLHLASKNGFLDVINYLLDNDAAIDLTDNYGWTLLHFAVKSRCEEIVLLCLERGCNENRKAKSGQTVRDICDDKKLICLLDKFDMIRRCFGKDMVPNLAKNPPTVPFLADSTLYATMRSIQLNPFIFEKHKNDARILAVLDALDKTTILDVGQTKQGVDGQMTTGHSDGIYSIQSAVEVISQTIRNIRDNSSAIAQCAMFILSMSLSFQTNRERILATAIMVGRIVNRMVQREIATQDPSILKVLDDIRNYFQTTIETQQPWKLFVHDARRQVIIQKMIKTIVRLQDRLLKVTQYLNIQINIQVVGNIYDVRLGMRNMIETMHGLNKCLEYIANFPSLRQQTDKLQELVIQMKRGLEHYSRQVEVGNIARNKEFESQVKKCHDQIEDTAKLMSQKNKTRYGIEKIESWMLSSDDIHFDPDNIDSALGRGGFATVFRGMYHGQQVAVKRFDQIVLADSPDLEKLIVKEVKAWKDVSHEPYILTLIGVCTKISTPILVCELCKTNIRRYVRDWPDALIPMIYQFACGLMSLHNSWIIHRDLKGDNVLITFQNTVAIADFGLSRAVMTQDETKTGNERSGTLNWMGPEQYLTPHLVTRKSDIWSFGMTVWEVLCNDIPYKDYGRYEIPEALVSDNERPRKPKELSPHLEPLWTLIAMCWQVDPADRPSAVDIVEYLKKHYVSEFEL